MTQDSDHQELIIRYLLGELRAEERRLFEQRWFADQELFEELLTVESEMIDNYARGKLSAPRRERFENYFLLSHERRQRLEIAGAIFKHARAEALKPPPKFGARVRCWWRAMLARLGIRG